MKNTYKYSIAIQFLKPQVVFDDEGVKVVEMGVKNYNTRSLIARNPKAITRYFIAEDKLTLFVELESEANLPMPTKALRIFSEYLAKNGFQKLISGKQLFKMTSEPILSEPILSLPVAQSSNITSKEIKIQDQEVREGEHLRRVNKYIELLISSDDSSRDKVKKIDEILNESGSSQE